MHDQRHHGTDASDAFHRAPRLIRRVLPGSIARLVEAFWALPLGLAVAGILAPFAFQYLPEEYLGFFIAGQENAEIDVDGARATLSVIATGIITITSLVFSLSFVALSITAQQLSPRILDYVVQERTTQVLVGLSIATFLFSSISLSFGITGGEHRLAASAVVALTLGTASLAMVVIFSHRMTRIMRAEDMVAWLGDAFVDAVREGPGSIDDEMLVRDAAAAAELERALAEAPLYRATETGYLGAVDYPGMLAWAEENDLRIEILWRENAFVMKGIPVARVLGGDDLDPDEIARRVTEYVYLTDRRVIGETAEYEASALCEAAVRALSPGINDPATARSCANRLFEGLAMLVSLPEKSRVLRSEDGVARVLRAPHGLAEFLEHAVAPILEAARDRATVRHIAGLTDTLSELTTRPYECATVRAFKARVDASDPPPERYIKRGEPVRAERTDAGA
jgi:uncharacterized membrane protein